MGHYFDGIRTHGFVKIGSTFTTIDYPGATETSRLGINNLGQIVGQYIDSAGVYHGFLATPAATVPEPSSLLSAVLGLAGLAGYAGWRRKSRVL